MEKINNYMFDKKIILLNSVLFSIIVFVVIFHYFSHYRTIQKEIISYIQLQTNSIARRIEISATNIFESQKFIENIIEKNLESQAKFIDLLNSIETFNREELKDFSEEANLDIIAIISDNSSIYYTSGYLTLNKLKNISRKLKGIVFLENKELILYVTKGFYSNSIIITGIYAKKFFEKRKKISLNGLIHKILNQREDIKEIKILNGNISKPIIKLKDNYFIVKIPFEAEKDKIILIKIDAYYPLKIIENFKHNIYVFIFVMVIIAIMGNIIIYYIQKKYILKIRDYEKEIARAEKDAALGRSAALIAHELRNPINAIGMGIQRILFETKVGENEEYHLLLNMMKKEINRMNRTIEDFLNYSKPIKINKKSVNLKELIDSILIFFQNKDRDLNIKTDIPETLKIEVDRELFSQVIMNLIKNVYENDKATYLFIKAEQKSGLTLLFENNGVYIEPDYCNRIFEPYFTTKTRGTGLGLAIVKKIVEAHNGKITCKIKNNIIRFIIKFS